MRSVLYFGRASNENDRVFVELAVDVVSKRAYIQTRKDTRGENFVRHRDWSDCGATCS
jgi:hypothetical protein